jgi:hypothetical protein
MPPGSEFRATKEDLKAGLAGEMDPRQGRRNCNSIAKPPRIPATTCHCSIWPYPSTAEGIRHVLARYFKSALGDLELPEETVVTPDEWCQSFYERRINKRSEHNH